jgi:hypothetical protein
MSAEPENLCIIWSSAHREAALNLAFMYGGNSMRRGWWKRVRIIAWGPSQPLLLGDGEVRAEFTALADAGVELMACHACAERYGVVADLEALGVDVQYTGQVLTDALKDPQWRVLTV